MQKENKWTTMSVEKELRPILDKVMLKMEKRLSYNDIVKKLAYDFLEKEIKENE